MLYFRGVGAISSGGIALYFKGYYTLGDRALYFKEVSIIPSGGIAFYFKE